MSKYNGYTNYETWLTKLYMDDDYNMISEITNSIDENHDGFSTREYPDFGFYRDYVEQWLETMTNDLPESNFLRDMFNAAIDNINIVEIAQIIRDDVMEHYEYEAKENNRASELDDWINTYWCVEKKQSFKDLVTKRIEALADTPEEFDNKEIDNRVY